MNKIYEDNEKISKQTTSDVRYLQHVDRKRLWCLCDEHYLGMWYDDDCDIWGLEWRESGFKRHNSLFFRIIYAFQYIFLYDNKIHSDYMDITRDQLEGWKKVIENELTKTPIEETLEKDEKYSLDKCLDEIAQEVRKQEQIVIDTFNEVGTFRLQRLAEQVLKTRREKRRAEEKKRKKPLMERIFNYLDERYGL